MKRNALRLQLAGLRLSGTGGRDQLRRRSQFVKVCLMPAQKRRRARTWRRRGGRRRTSLEGGNRGMPGCGPGTLDGYGDLRAGFRVGHSIRAGRAGGEMARMPDVGDARLESWMTQRTRN